ncbi:MAG: hypothetical protein ABF474_04130, partial [Zymomonas mobilis]
PIPYNLQHYKDRNCIERMLNKLKQFRRIATGYDKTRKRFSGKIFSFYYKSMAICRSGFIL